MGTNIDKFVEPSEIPGSVAVPLGGIIGWMNPAAAAMNPTPPAGFEFCDGTAVSTVGSPFFGQLKPNLMVTSAGGAKGIARGANVTAAPYGVGTALVTGGSDVHNHTVNNASNHNHGLNSHTHNMNNHTHSVASSGAHDHGFTGTANQSGVPATGSSYQGGVFYHNHAVSSTNSNHSHTTAGPSAASTAAPSVSNTADAGSHGHSTNNNSVFPAFHTEVASIVRVL